LRWLYFLLLCKIFIENSHTLKYNNYKQLALLKFMELIILTAEDLKKFDKRISKIQYPFGENYPAFHRMFMEVAEKENMSLSDVVQQYVGWKYSKK